MVPGAVVPLGREMGGKNGSVEQITRVFFVLKVPRFQHTKAGGALGNIGNDN